MPPRKRKGETPDPATSKRSSRKAVTKRQTALPVNAPLPDAVKESTEVPKEMSAVTEDSERKNKVHVSSVHKQFIQESVEDANGIKTWSSKCIHCPTGSKKGEFKSKQASHLKMHLKKNHPPIFLMVGGDNQPANQSEIRPYVLQDEVCAGQVWRHPRHHGHVEQQPVQVLLRQLHHPLLRPSGQSPQKLPPRSAGV